MTHWIWNRQIFFYMKLLILDISSFLIVYQIVMKCEWECVCCVMRCSLKYIVDFFRSRNVDIITYTSVIVDDLFKSNLSISMIVSWCCKHIKWTKSSGMWMIIIIHTDLSHQGLIIFAIITCSFTTICIDRKIYIFESSFSILHMVFALHDYSVATCKWYIEIYCSLNLLLFNLSIRLAMNFIDILFNANTQSPVMILILVFYWFILI